MNDNTNMFSSLPVELKVHLDILAKENRVDVDSFIVGILSDYVLNEFDDFNGDF